MSRDIGRIYPEGRIIRLALVNTRIIKWTLSSGWRASERTESIGGLGKRMRARGDLWEGGKKRGEPFPWPPARPLVSHSFSLSLSLALSKPLRRSKRIFFRGLGSILKHRLNFILPSSNSILSCTCRFFKLLSNFHLICSKLSLCEGFFKALVSRSTRKPSSLARTVANTVSSQEFFLYPPPFFPTW